MTTEMVVDLVLDRDHLEEVGEVESTSVEPLLVVGPLQTRAANELRADDRMFQVRKDWSLVKCLS